MRSDPKRFVTLLLCLSLLAVPRAALAFCGFYVSGADGALFNNATQVVLMRDGTRTVLSMQNNYQGPAKNFAMIVPVPVVLQKENVKTLPRDVFSRIDQLAAPRLVEYWEQDPCRQDVTVDKAMPSPMMHAAKAGGGGPGSLGVTIEAQFTVGEYEIVILSAKDSAGLDTWLRQEKYNIPPNAEPLLRPYVQSGSKFFVAKVDVTKVSMENGMATLSPLRFHYDTDTFSLPIRLGLVNSAGTQDLIVHILARGQRYEVANYPNVTIPTNLDVSEKARGEFGAFYASLFDRTVAAHPKAIVTEYSWDASSCDPCPSPALTPSELATLGADVLPSNEPGGGGGGGGALPTPGPVPAPGSGARPTPSPMIRRPPPWGFGSGFVLTRLHARYGKDALGEDLVFRAAPPIAGGREFLSTDGALEKGAVPAGTNNFQGRYAIRHPWTGPIACDNPVRGVWGGPPAGVQAPDDARPKAATNTAFAPRQGIELASYVTPQAVAPLALAGVQIAAPATSGSSVPAAADAAAAVPTKETTGGGSGCGKGCATAHGRDRSPAGAALLAALSLVALAVRRRSRA